MTEPPASFFTKDGMTVTALREFDFKGRPYVAGDVLEVAPVEAAVLRRLRHVALESDLDTRTRALTAAAPRKRRAYRRRDLTAEA